MRPITKVVFSSSGYALPARTHVLRGDVPALQLIPAEDGRVRWGPLVRLSKGTELHDFGKAFDNRTLRVRVDGHFYIVFSQDLDKAQKAESPMQTGLD